MCREAIALAICAPQNPPLLSFTCGKLHLVAGHRDVCVDARGACICFFGTCGVVERDFSTVAVDFTTMTKLRCAHCTTREDAVGERRSAQEILESPLLQRHALPVGDSGSFRKHRDILKGLWGGEPSCPFHAVPDLEVEETTETGVDEEADETTPTPTMEVASPENTTESPAKPTDSVVSQSPIEATAPEMTTSSSPRLEMVNGLENGLESGLGLKSSRWANASSPEKTTPPKPRSDRPSRLPEPSRRDSTVAKDSSKLRDAARHIATAKSFLAKKVTR
ncbi:hypothetical protein QQZ08_001467 [Neonectria magnoliae]|uniref:Uncharacterized protein n=1 Tax=Neonectria magnoliae TaxID=2732573 RepID=A0ABR1IEZ1_9HYPO